MFSLNVGFAMKSSSIKEDIFFRELLMIFCYSLSALTLLRTEQGRTFPSELGGIVKVVLDFAVKCVLRDATAGTFTPRRSRSLFTWMMGYMMVQYAQRRDNAKDAVRVPNVLDAAHADGSLAEAGKCSLLVCCCSKPSFTG
jgi:hypothetical protein